jgi:hypothetical protein
MRYFFRKSVPAETRLLLVESGSRHLIEKVLPSLQQAFGSGIPLGLVTCYSGLPAGFPSDTAIYQVADYAARAGRKRLYRELARQRYTVLVLLCSAEPIMTKWKWAIAFGLPAKVLIVNENADFFWLDRSNWGIIRHFVLYRAGLTGSGAVRTLARVLLFPFTLLYLLLYAAAVHLRRISDIGNRR